MGKSVHCARTSQYCWTELHYFSLKVALSAYKGSGPASRCPARGTLGFMSQWTQVDESYRIVLSYTVAWLSLIPV